MQFSRNQVEQPGESSSKQASNPGVPSRDIQIVKLRVSKLQTQKKFTTPVEQVSDHDQQSGSQPLSKELSPFKIGENSNSNFQEPSPHRGHQVLSLQSPSSIKIIDLRQPKVRRLLMDSLQEIVDGRKTRYHQRESKLFNEKYEQIIQDAKLNRTLKIETSIPHPQGTERGPGSPTPDSQLEQQIISRGDLSLCTPANTQENITVHQISKSNSLASLSNRNLEDDHNQQLGRMTQQQQLRLIQKLNQICSEQFQNNGRGSVQSSEPQSGSDEAGAGGAGEEPCQIFSAINNDCLLYIDNSTYVKSEKKLAQPKHLSEAKRVSPLDTLSIINEPSASSLKMFDPQLYLRQIDNSKMLEELSKRLMSIQKLQNQNALDANQGFVSRNNQQPKSNNPNIVQQVSTDQQTLFIQSLSQSRVETETMYSGPNVSEAPSVSNLTFFDLSNPQHLNQLFEKLELIQRLEQREVPKLRRTPSPSATPEPLPDEDALRVQNQGSQSGEASEIASSSCTKTPVHSRQGIEQHQIDVDLLVQKLLQIPNVDVLESIFEEGDPEKILNIDLQPSNGTNEPNGAHSPYFNYPAASSRKPGSESISSGGRASEVQSSGIMTPKSQHSLSTPNQIRLLQERNFTLNNIRIPLMQANLNSQSGGHGNQNDLMSPLTKKLLMQKLIEVQEQIGDSASDSSDGPLPHHMIDGHVAGSIPSNPQLFDDPPKPRDPSIIVQKAIDQRTKLIISQIDEEDENL